MTVQVKQFKTIIEIAFEFENAEGYIVNDIMFYINSSNVTSKELKPVCITLIATNGKRTYSLREIVETIGYIPVFVTSCKLNGKHLFYVAKMNNNLAPVTNRAEQEMLKTSSRNAFEYTLQKGVGTLSDEEVQRIHDTLRDNNIEYVDYTPGDILHGLTLYPSLDASKQVFVSFTGFTDDAVNCIIPNIREFNGKRVSLGCFNIKRKHRVTIAMNEHIALIRECQKCGQTHVYDYWDGTKSVCPYCGKQPC